MKKEEADKAWGETRFSLFVCPCCKKEDVKAITLSTDFGFETFGECCSCGILLRVTPSNGT